MYGVTHVWLPHTGWVIHTCGALFLELDFTEHPLLTHVWLADGRRAVEDLEDDVAVGDGEEVEVDHQHLGRDHAVVRLELEEARVSSVDVRSVKRDAKYSAWTKSRPDRLE